MKQKVNYVGFAIALGLFVGTHSYAQRQITNRITDRIYKADVQPARERMPNVINTLLHDEYAPAISADGRTLVYQSNRGGKVWEYYRLWEAKRDTVTGFWQEPKPIEAINSKAADGDFIGGPSLSYDGNTMYFFAKMGGGNEDIYMSQRTANGDWGAPTPVAGAVNTGDYEGFPSISSDGQRLYFVRKGSTEGNTQCFKLMVSKLNIDGSWAAAEELPSPVNAGCEKHIRILPDNESIFFSTTRRGGSPKNSKDFDLYYAHMKPGNTWGEPVPADIAPFVKNNLYSYQSDLLVSVAPHDHPHVLAYFNAYVGASHELFTIPLPEGLKPKRICEFNGSVVDAVTGKLLDAMIKVDNETRSSLSYALKTKEGKIKTVLTEGNKYKFTVEVEGYETITTYSDLTNGFDGDDCGKIFAMKRLGVKATIAVIDGLTREAIENGVVGIKANDASKGKISEQKKIGPGKYEALLAAGTTYCAEGTADQYVPAVISLDLTNKQAGDTINREIMLYDLTKIAFDNINFATARPRNTTPKELSASLLPKSIQELDKVVKFLQDYPQISISIEGHTDYRGNDKYNQGLSERRVAAARQYIISKGIAANRIEAKGFGETSPVVPNEVNGKPDQANMALNRRVEFKVVQKGSDGQRCN
jgi:outer membrane protein OmpA-like peptidoglycan-associated protein